MGKCQCTRLIFVWASWLVFPSQDSLSLCYAINPLYALIVCVVHRGRTSCAFITRLANGRCWHFRCPGAKSSIAVCYSVSASAPSYRESSCHAYYIQMYIMLMDTHAHTHTCRQALAHMCVVMHELSYHARTQRCSPSLSPPLKMTQKAIMLSVSFLKQFQHIAADAHTYTQATICRLGWNKTNTSRVAGAIIANPLCV